MPQYGWVHLDVDEILRITEKAMLLLLDDGEEVWIPLSQISRPLDYSQGDTNCTISITEWIAKQKGLDQ